MEQPEWVDSLLDLGGQLRRNLLLPLLTDLTRSYYLIITVVVVVVVVISDRNVKRVVQPVALQHVVV